MHIGRTSKGIKHSPPIADIELRQIAHFSQLPSDVVQIAEEATAQHADIAAYSNQKPFVDTQIVEKATAAYATEHVTKVKFTL